MALRVLGVDPGFANFGWAVARVYPGGFEVEALGVIVTKPSSKKLKVLAADDNVRRARELARGLESVWFDCGVPSAVCAEAMSFPRQASNAAKMATAWGILVAYAEGDCLPIASASPQALKRAVCGRVSVGDAELHAAIESRQPEVRALIEGVVPKSKREHAYDAVGAIIACQQSDVVRALARAAA